MPTTGLSYGNIPLQNPLANFKANIAESAQDTVVRLLKTSLRVEMVTVSLLKKGCIEEANTIKNNMLTSCHSLMALPSPF
jgi:hypothetical protein